jgi:hypothetical protein
VKKSIQDCLFLFFSCTIVLTSSLLAETYEAANISAPRQAQPDRLQYQRFICNLGYSVAECRRQIAIVQRVVARYHGEDLGKWTWVLVRSEDWKPLMQRLSLAPSSPAFSSLDQHAIFLEEAIVAPGAARAGELLRDFEVPLNQLLDFAVSHEMGHALCQEANEFIANQFGRQLREGKRPPCVRK